MAKVISGATVGLDSVPVEVEVNIERRGFPKFNIVGLPGKAVEEAKEVGFSLIKVNVVSVRGFNDDELFDFVVFADKYDIVVRFIEFMPFFGNRWPI